MKIKPTLTFAAILLANFLYAQQIAFPGAEGYGKYATGGRGGRVVEVTNLQDYDPATETPIPGSFRAVVNDGLSDPLTVVFRASGIIHSKVKYLEVNRSNLTIAGQTAPGAGICFKNAKVKLNGNNIIVRYLRFRVGDSLGLSLSATGTENFRNVIIDHCSMSWSAEENQTMYDNMYTTVQYCIISEGLYHSVNVKGNRAYGSQWGGQYASYHHNLIAHCASRSPRFNGARSNDHYALVDFRNNVVFNWGGSSSIYGGEVGLLNAKCLTQMVNNYYKPGPATTGYYFVKPSSGTYGYGKWHIAGNVMEGRSTATLDNWSAVNRTVSIDSLRSDSCFDDVLVHTQSASDAYLTVLDNAGARLPLQDSVDMRIIEEIKGLRTIGGGVTFGTTSGIIDDPSDVGGWPTYISTEPPIDTDHDGMPDEWEKNHGLDTNNVEDGKIIASDGYSNLEHYLNANDVNIAYPDSIIITTIDSAINTEKGSIQLSAQVYPEELSQEVLWSVNDTSLGTITSTGLFTALNNGTATIYASPKEFNMVASKQITITNQFVKPASVAFITLVTKINISQGTKQLKAKVLPYDASQSLEWSVSDTSLASVSDSGLLQAKRNGIIKVYANAKGYDDVIDSLTITLSNQPSATDIAKKPVLGIMPNPAGNFIQILSDSETEVTITQILGQQILKTVVQPNDIISIENYTPGIYFVSLKSGMNTKTIKMQKR